jgi:lysophospholipase L1-like esterase
VEAALRLLGVDPLAGVRRGEALLLRLSEDPEIEYELTPGARGRAWGTDVTVNALGFRGAETTEAPARPRLVVLGDSVAFGASVPAGAEFPARLGERLKERFEVLNLAVGGYDTANEAAVLAGPAARLSPELVVVAYCLNDVGVVSANRDYLRGLERYRGPLFASRLAVFVATRLDRRALEEADERENDEDVFVSKYRGRIDPVEPGETDVRALMAQAPRPMPLRWYADDFRIGRLRHAFARMHAVARGRGFRVVVAILPWLEDTDGRYPYGAVHALVSGEARRAGLEVLDLAPRLEPAGLHSLRRAENPKDACHPSARGHELVAGAIADWVETNAAGRPPSP